MRKTRRRSDDRRTKRKSLLHSVIVAANQAKEMLGRPMSNLSSRLMTKMRKKMKIDKRS